MAAASVDAGTPRNFSDGASGFASATSVATSGRSPAASIGSSQRLTNRPFGFESQASYSARHELTRMRDSNFCIRPKPVDDDIWKRPPPDFRPQCFEPKPPKRNSREAMQPWRYGPLPAELKAEAEARKKEEQETLELPDLMKPKEAKEGDFDLRFHVMDSDEGRSDFVKNGMYNPGPYHNPTHHDYRQYPSLKSLGLPKFDTSFDADPYNIRFNSQRLRIIHGLSRGVPPERNITGQQMCPPLKQPPKWESRLHLPAGEWPTPVAQYSRFRPFWRSPQTVLLDRMENTLTTQWAKEKDSSAQNLSNQVKLNQKTLVKSSHL